MSITIIQQEDAMAEQDRKARPFVVGEAANPGVIERFSTRGEADAFAAELGDGFYVDDES